MPFGFKHWSSIFQRLSDGVHFIMNQEGHQVWNYIDDFLCVSLSSKISKIYTRLQELLLELGLTISSKKLVPPSTEVTCLGIVVNTVDFTVSIPTEKLLVIKELCHKWTSKNTCTKQLQSLLGSLLYVAKCIKYARYFLNRMLALLRQNLDTKLIYITKDFKQDLNWFNTFLSVYNGVSFFHYIPSKIVHLDACPYGLGAIFDSQVHALELPHQYHHVNIAYLEMLNIIVALKVWHQQWTGLKVQIKCDNQAVVSVLNSGRSRDVVLAEYARNIFLWTSTCNIDLQVVHVPGKLNEVADLLSRWFITNNSFQKLQELVDPVQWLLYCILIKQYNTFRMFNLCLIVVTASKPVERQLAAAATSRLSHAFCDSTKKAYSILFRTYLAFVVFMNWNFTQVTVSNLLCFLECLNYNGVKYLQMANYLSAIRTHYLLCGLDVASFSDARLKFYQKAVRRQAPLSIRLNKLIDIPLLKDIVEQCNYMYMGQVFKALYLLSFYSFLRLSNLVPHALSKFLPLKHLARGDVLFRPNKLIIVVKWSKTMQTNNQIKLITIPAIVGSNLCPVTAISNFLAITPKGPNLPLFQFKNVQNWVPLTDSRVRNHFAQILQKLGLAHSGLTLHTFRRSGATFAFNNNVALQNIQRYGTWTSDYVWRYITDSTDAGEQVADMFRSKLSN